MKIYCNKNRFNIDVENGNGDLKALKYFQGKDVWVMTYHAPKLAERYIKILDVKDNYLIVFDELRIFYLGDAESGDGTLEISIKHAQRDWIQRYGTFIRPFEILTDEEVADLIKQYGVTEEGE